MSFTHQFNNSVVTPGRTIQANFTVTDDDEQSLDVVVGNAVTDMQVDTFDFIVARLKAIFIVSDQDITLETNNAGAPTNTIALKANKPLIWYSGSYFANPFTADVTALFFTNAGAVAANVKLTKLVDPTP